MVISINKRTNIDSVDQNTIKSSKISKNDLITGDDDDLNNNNNKNNENSLNVRFHLDSEDEKSVILSSSPVLTTTIEQQQQEKLTLNKNFSNIYSSNDIHSQTPTTTASPASINEEQVKFDLNTTNEDYDESDDFIQLARKHAHNLNSDDDNAVNYYVEPNTSWNLWNLFYDNQKLIEEIEFKIFSNFKDLACERNFVNICNNSLRIWTLAMNTESKNTPIVLVHGFCGGLGLWIHNLKLLSKSRPLYAFDVLGFGRSSRPSFSSDAIVSETQFVESIEDWRKELNIKEMILLGHSFGGYLISSYAIKYPQHTKALLLIDPWGFQEHSNLNKLDTPTPMWVRLLTNVSRYVSPLSVLRTTGPIGVPLFKFLKPDFKRKYMNVLGNTDLIYDYLYHCNKQYPSGEDGFKAVSELYGFAKNPMIKRIDKVSSKIPIWFIYGSRSWIDSTPGFSTKYIRNRFAYVSVKIIPGAGHHVYADKPDLFNEYVDEILDLIDTHDDDTNQNYPTTSSCSSSLLNCN